jgi:hypothetical protein
MIRGETNGLEVRVRVPIVESSLSEIGKPTNFSSTRRLVTKNIG